MSSHPPSGPAATPVGMAAMASVSMLPVVLRPSELLVPTDVVQAAQGVGRVLLDRQDAQPAIVSWVAGAANDAELAAEGVVDSAVQATLASLLGESAVWDAEVLAPGRDLGQPAGGSPVFALGAAENPVCMSADALSLTLAGTSATLDAVMLVVDDLALLPLQGMPDNVAWQVDSFAHIPPSADSTAFDYNGDFLADDGLSIELIGDSFDPGLSLL